jgi:hypothetical protein
MSPPVAPFSRYPTQEARGMALRRFLALVVFLGAFASLGATYRTQNFVVEAATPQAAQQAGQYAEKYRKEKALQWINQEMPPWPEPCPLKVTVTMGGAGGATSFAFDRGRVLGQNMHIEGSYERLMNSVLPHEVTHTVFAFYFRTPVPRWADEGGAVLSEDDVERNRHDTLCRQILNAGRAIPLRRLFALKEYPSDVMALYAEGYSVTNFLVSSSSRPQFLGFVDQGMREGWDRAAQAHYGYRSVEELERAWIDSLRAPQRPTAQVASAARPAAVEPTRQVLVRQTVPPAQPFEATARPVYRGQAEDDGNPESARGGPGRAPGYLPDYAPPARPAALQPPVPQEAWQPVAAAPSTAVRLGPPDFGAVPGGPSPVGYPR